MKIGRVAACGALLVVALLAGCAVGPDQGAPAHPEHGPLLGVIKGPSAMSADELQDLQHQPVAEQRRRLDLVLAAHPDDLNARFLRLQTEFELEDVAAVEADSRLVLADPSLAPHLRQLTLSWRAEALIQLQRFDEAASAADQAVQLEAVDNLNRAQALAARGWARFFIHQVDGALADFDGALHADPSQGVVYYRRAQVFDARGNVDRAIADFERALALAPDDGPNHREYGVLLYRCHDLERALAQFDASVRLMPGDPLALAWRAQTNVALGRLDAAAADDRHVDSLPVTQEERVDAVNHVAVELRNAHDFASAVRVFSHSLTLQSNPGVAADLARMQWFSGQFAQALKTSREHHVSPAWDDRYKPIAQYVIRGRADPADEPAARAELASTAAPHQPHDWPDTLVRLLLGRTTLDAALAEADASDTAKLKAGRRCEADYYSAEQTLMHGEVVQASRLLDEASRVCPSTYFEATAAVAERRLIAAKSTRP